MPIDLYRTMELDPGAIPEVIHGVYPVLRRLYDPANNPDAPEAAAKRLWEIDKAYAILGNPERRAEYDRQRAIAPAQNRPSPPCKPPADLKDTTPLCDPIMDTTPKSGLDSVPETPGAVPGKPDSRTPRPTKFDTSRSQQAAQAALDQKRRQDVARHADRPQQRI